VTDAPRPRVGACSWRGTAASSSGCAGAFFPPDELPAPLFAPLARLVAERDAAFLVTPVAGDRPLA
jgi:hypothetical protein